MKRILLALMVIWAAAPSMATTLEWWDFEDGTDGATFFSMPPLYTTHRGSTGLINGIVMRGYSDAAGPSF
jgi:hypothetical protein